MTSRSEESDRSAGHCWKCCVCRKQPAFEQLPSSDESSFYIPAESNILSFRVLRQNSGSGDWWLYVVD